MSNEIQVSYGMTNRTVYAVIRNLTSGYVWSLSGGTAGAYEIFTSGNWSNYAISLTEQGVTSTYVGNVPSAVPAGTLSVEARDRAGATAAQTDSRVAAGNVEWNGTAYAPLSDTATSGQVGQLAPLRMAKGKAISGFMFSLVSSADHVTDFTSGVVSGQISRNGGAFGALQSGTISEVGLGTYKVNLTSGDLNADTVFLYFNAVGISGGAADPRKFSIITQPVSGAI